jgi:AAA15 family ATPase/GTPase
MGVKYMLKKIKLLNFLGFTRDNRTSQITDNSDMFEVDFCGGANIFIGENGTGKTSLLKLIYAFCLYNEPYGVNVFAAKIEEMFAFNNRNNLFSFNRDELYIEIEDNKKLYNAVIKKISDTKINPPKDYTIPAVFIPSKEMLSHSLGFMALSRKMRLPFDRTLIDIMMNAELPESVDISELNQVLLDKISEVIDGKVVYKNDTFYIAKNDGTELVFSFEAEGLRKFGLLWKIIRNGLFDESNSVLFWDEPEANLNPELIPVLVEILLELQKSGVQLFIATHSSNFAQYFDVLRTKDNSVMFHNLYKKDDGYIYCHSAERYDKLAHNSIERADERLGNVIIEKALEEVKNG